MNKAKKTTSAPFERIEGFLEKNSRNLLIITLIISAILVALNFDAKISTANDDALYIQGAYNYVHLFPDWYYTSNAPLYVMVLALVNLIFGFDIVAMKVFSSIFFLMSIFFFYKAFYKRVPHVVLFPVLMIMAVNPLMLEYASLTFTEAFFMMVQTLFFWLFLSSMEKMNAIGNAIKDTWKYWLVIGLMLFIQYLTRNVAATTIAAVILYFLLTKRYKEIAYAIGAFILFVVLYDFGIKRMIWGDVSQFSSQGSAIMQKDYYDASKGMEDLAGFVDRLFVNTGIYYGSRFWEILGLQSDKGGAPNTFGAIITLTLFIFGIVQAWKHRQHPLILVSCYVLVLTGATFLALHTYWAQARMIMVHVPYILLVSFFGIVVVIKKNYPVLRPVYIGVAILLIIIGLFSSLSSGTKNIRTLSKNLKGDLYEGYTPDWQNFLKMSEWSAKNLHDTALVASRKQPMSFVYGKGKNFYAIYNVPSQDPDTLINKLRSAGVSHVILGSLRTNPLYADGNVISTVHRYLYTIAQKYPDAFELVHEEGAFEKAQLYKINYTAVDRRRHAQPE